MKIDPKSIIIGLLLGVCITLISGAVVPGESSKYQVSGTSDSAWLADTQTGQVWCIEKLDNQDDPDWIAKERTKWYDYGAPGAR